MGYMNTIASASDAHLIARDRLSERVAEFAGRMNRIPRRALRCEVYGTVSIVVDERHALNIFRKVFGRAVDSVVAYEALAVLSDRLDENGGRS